jgi:hypothetical protein
MYDAAIYRADTLQHDQSGLKEDLGGGGHTPSTIADFGSAWLKSCWSLDTLE